MGFEPTTFCMGKQSVRHWIPHEYACKLAVQMGRTSACRHSPGDHGGL